MSRQLRHLRLMVVILAMASLCATGVQANVVIDLVPVGNPGNAADTRYAMPGYGRVDYTYNIGKYEVTAAQYAAFLNAVAATDTYGLYNEYMDYSLYSGEYGCNIQRSGSSGSYTYSVAPDWANRPVNWVSWGDAVRFANWMHNGQPNTGVQDSTTTEDGSYWLNGATTDAQLLAVTRKPNATWVIPSEDEWYKAAYHKNDGVTGNYWDYPTGTNDVPNNGNPEGDTGNSATFYDGDYTIGSPYWRTDMDFFEQSDSPYGTLDQGGNLWEWNEAVISGSYRGQRGGSFGTGDFVNTLSAAYRDKFSSPTLEDPCNGFRMVLPEPASMVLLALGGVVMLRKRRDLGQ